MRAHQLARTSPIVADLWQVLANLLGTTMHHESGARLTLDYLQSIPL